MNSSSTLARVQVSEIALRSFSISDGAYLRDIGVMMIDLSNAGRVPSTSDRLNKS